MFASKQRHPVAFIAEGIEEDSNIVVVISYDHSTGLATCIASCDLDKDVLLTNSDPQTDPALAYLYTMASDISDLSLPPHAYLVSTDTSNPLILGQTLPLDTCVTDTTLTYINIPFPAQYVANKPPKRKGVQVKKKYKPVAMKTKPVTSHISKDFQIERQIIGNPLATIPPLNPNAPPFVPTNDEINVLVDMVAKQEKAFAWEDSKRGSLRPDFFPPVCIPTIPHIPWVQHNHPIPPGLEKEICEIIHGKISAGIYEPSNSAYRLRWFCILKKNGKLRIVHSLEPLNRVTIRHSGVPPFPDHVAESFAGRICGATLNLYIGYNERLINPASRDLTTFQTPFGALRLVTLPMGWTNSVPIFHDDITFILQPEIPHNMLSFINDIGAKGPKDWKIVNGKPAKHPANLNIHLALWEFFELLNRILQ
ncbi:hypothetical protein E4T56_gene1548 [Termitomyces sp. T112]|nr:hypothetical protein E4T56_gene1548 [Termitomyces sp. T112]